MEPEENAVPAALLGAYWLMDDSPSRCRPGCPWCRARPERFATGRPVGRVVAARTVMVAVSALVVLAALGATLSAAS